MSFPAAKIILRISAIVMIPVFIAVAAFEILLRTGIVPNTRYERMQYDGERRAVTRKVMVLGDSFADNWHTGKSLYELLAAGLGEKGMKVLNTARGGMDPTDYLDELRLNGREFGPDDCLLFYYVGNDLSGVRERLAYRGSKTHMLKERLKQYARHLYLYSLYKEKKAALGFSRIDFDRIRNNGVPAEVIDKAKTGQINPYLLEAAMKDRYSYRDSVMMDDPGSMLAWSGTEQILKAIKHEADSLGGRLFIIVIPDTIQVDRSHFRFMTECGFVMDERTVGADGPQRLLKAFAAEENIPCLDLLPYFKEARGKELYKENDNHLNDEGSFYAARLVLEWYLGLGDTP